MNVKQLTISHGITVNMGQGTYESEKFDLSLTLEVQDGETVSLLSIAASEEINHLLAEELRARMFQPELEGTSYVDKIIAAPGTLDAKLRALRRHPFWNWIVRLEPELAQEMENEVRDSVVVAEKRVKSFGHKSLSLSDHDPIADITDDDYLPDSADEE